MQNDPITKEDLNKLEKFADEMFGKLGIDVNFTKHFLERVNDERNKKQITYEELTRLFREEYSKWGKKIAQLGPDKEAILRDMKTNINLPFALNWDSKNGELDLVAKTVMRKSGFKSPDPFFTIAEDAPANNVGDGNIAGLGVGPQGALGIKMPARIRYKRKNAQKQNQTLNDISLMKRKTLQEDAKISSFAGEQTFIVPSSVFQEARYAKSHGRHWRTYIGEDGTSESTIHQHIRAYAAKNPKKPIILQDERTGAMMYARYGKK